MVNYQTAFPSKFLKAADVEGEEPIYTIKQFTMEKFVEGEPLKPAIFFEEIEKGMALNKTNGKIIARVAGSNETDDWIGKKIQLYCAMVEFKGDMVEAIRVKMPPRPARKKADELNPPDDDPPF